MYSRKERLDKIKLQPVDYAIAGAASGVVTRALVTPLDFMKIRLQLRVSSGDAGGGRGMLQELRHVVREEGLRCLWKGHVPAQLLSFTYGAAQFYSYETLMKAVAGLPIEPEGLGQKRVLSKAGMNFVCGGMAGSFATLTAHPLDVLRTRFVAQTTGDSKIYRGLVHAVMQMSRTEGWRAFYRGLSPTLLLVFPQTGLQFSIYHSLGYSWQETLGDKSLIGFPRSSVCGLVAGMLSKLAVLPLDLIKKRLQVQGFERAWCALGRTVEYRGGFDCLCQVWKNEGVAAFYKGAIPSALKAGLSVALIFTTYEQCLVLASHLRAGSR